MSTYAVISPGEVYTGCGAVCGGEWRSVFAAIPNELQDWGMETQDAVYEIPRKEVRIKEREKRAEACTGELLIASREKGSVVRDGCLPR